ncbi:MAG: flavin reductase [Mycoplasmatales bacterium]
MQEVPMTKFYYGFPIFLLAYKDENNGYNFSTMSSSYSVHNSVIMGISKRGNAYRQISKYKNFSINLIPPENKHFIEYGSKRCKESKFKLSPDLKFKIDKDYDVPLIEGCKIQLVCQMHDEFITSDLPRFINVGAKIKKRFFATEYLKDGKVDPETLHTLNFYFNGNDSNYRPT